MPDDTSSIADTAPAAPVHRDYAYGRWLVRRRWLVIAATVAAVAAAVFGAQRLTMNPDNRVFFSKDNPHLLALEQLENTYSKTDNIFITLAPADGDVFSRDTLAAIRELTEASWQVPYSSRVDSITNYQHTTAIGDDLFVADLFEDPETLDDGDLAARRNTTLSRPALIDRLVSPDGSVTAINIITIKPGDSTQEVVEIGAFLRAMLADFQAAHADIEVYLTGGIMFDLAFSEIPLEDGKTLMPIMLGLIILLLAITLRTVWGTVLTVAVVVFSLGVAMGLIGWLGAVLNAGTMSAPVIILTLSVAHCVHVIFSMRREMRRGRDADDAIVESLRINMSPIFITSITTAIGFLSMNFSDAPPFRLLGNIVAIGVMAAFVLSVTFLPAGLAAWKPRIEAGETFWGRFMERLAELVVRRRQLLFWGVGTAIVVSALGIAKIALDDNFVEYFDHRYPIRTDAEFIEDRLTGINGIQYSIPAAGEGGISDPEYLDNLERFATFLRAQPEVVHVNVLTNVFKQLNMNMHGDDRDFYRIPEDRELAAQYLLLFEMSLPYGLDLNDQINVPKSASRVGVLVTDTSSRDLRDVDARAQAWLVENMPAMAAPGTGLSMIFAHISERNIDSMLLGSSLALVLISFILIFALRSLPIGLISLVPNLFPAAMAFGLWGYVSGQVGLAIAVVLAMTLGIVVDDTVHFLSKYLRGRRELHLNSDDAVRYAFRTVGLALGITSLVLITGFGVLTFSGFKVNAEMGLLSAMTICLALVADLLFLPTLLMKLDRRSYAAPSV